MEANSKRTGHFLKLTFEIVDGPHKSVKQFARLNLDNPNATATQIARGGVERDLSRGRRAGPQRLGRPAQLAAGDSREVQETNGHGRHHQRSVRLLEEGVGGGGSRSRRVRGLDAALEALLMLQFELPYPPSINHYWRRVGARTLISREGRRFRQRVVAILGARRVEPLNGPLVVDVESTHRTAGGGTSTTCRSPCWTPCNTAGRTPTTARSSAWR